MSDERPGHDLPDGRGRTGLHRTGRDLTGNADVRVRDVEVTSDGWHVLRRTTFDYRGRDGAWTTQSRETYDRGNGATVLLYDPAGRTLLLSRQFRLPAYVNGHPDGMLIESAAGLLDGDSPEKAIRREAAEELGVRIDPADLEPLTSMHRTGANGRAVDERVDWFLGVRRWEGEPALQESKASDLAWHRLDALPADVVPHERAVLIAVAEGTLAAISTYGFDPAEAAAQAAANGE